MKRRIAILLILMSVLAICLNVSAWAAYEAVSLDVPSYKQFDSRWGSVIVGESGKTLSKIGCAVTSLAMTESYRTGTAITPEVMESRLSFDESGALYWPGNYVFPGTLDYAQLYALLKSGIPVIYGAKKTGGGTHFIVVRGYEGGDGLSASGFLIHDPGSSTRTKLSQFLAIYPTVYRRVHYTK